MGSLAIGSGAALSLLTPLALAASVGGPGLFGAAAEFFRLRSVGAVDVVSCSCEGAGSWPGLAMQKRGHDLLVMAKCLGDGSPRDDNLTAKAEAYPTGVFVDLSCDGSFRYLEKMSDSFLFNTSFVYLLFANNYEETLRFLNDTNLGFDSDVTVLVNDTLLDVYRVQPWLPIISEEVGTCGVRTDGPACAVRKRPRRTDLGGAVIKAVLVLAGLNPSSTEPQLLDRTYNPGIDLLTRFSLPLYKALEGAYNFRMEYVVARDWGYYDKATGHFTDGMLHLIEEEKADFGVTLARRFHERMDVATFAPALQNFRTCFVFRHPSTLAAYTAFAMPFALSSWLGLLSLVLVGGTSIRLIRSFDVRDDPPNEPSFVASVLLVTGTMCQQGLYTDSLRMPTRVVTITMEIAAVLLYAYYGAEIVGFLLSPAPKTINTVEKLLASPLELIAENLPYHVNHFTSNLSDKATKAYYQGLQHENSFVNLTHGIRLVQGGGFAMYSQDSNLYNVIERTFAASERCSLSEIEIIRLKASPILKKRSSFRELVFRGLLLLRENGLVMREDKIWHAQKPACIGTEESGEVSLEATLIAQGIFACGLVLASAVYFLEKRCAAAKERPTHKGPFLNCCSRKTNI